VQIVPVAGIPIVGVVLGFLVVAIAGNWLWALDFFHVVGGGLWTGIDLFVGFVIGPILGRLSIQARMEFFARFMPNVFLIMMPTLVTMTLASGWQLARHLNDLSTRRRKQLDAGGGKLDAQRQPIEASGYLRHRSRMLRRARSSNSAIASYCVSASTSGRTAASGIASRSVSAVTRSLPLSGLHLTTWAIPGGTSAASLGEARETAIMPSGKSSRSHSQGLITSRVFLVPPGPVMVSTCTSGRRSSSLISAISRSRPTRRLGSSGTLFDECGKIREAPGVVGVSFGAIAGEGAG